ncbi:aldose epimerase family protein [Flammeovirgaceae bacterium SG7u.111]|nr:aldose epimerase family protein [Flammeovirgaceae bacterium SG7u.132]WPO34391.1 aldose epimerase family protein [Flammeovirgaceae bacterium SG7u.111]
MKDMHIEKNPFGFLPNGLQADKYVLKNKNGMEVTITNLGATLIGIKVPDKKGDFDDVLLGYDDLDGYLANDTFMGVVCGRYANRIANGKFTLDGKKYSLAINNGPNHLHGGEKGFDKALWKGSIIGKADLVGVEMRLFSKDMEEGYPGNVEARVIYSLNNDNELTIDYMAVSDKSTVINLTNHAYFNLKGEGKGDILDHELKLNASRFTPTDNTSIPTGELRDVADTPMDFMEFKAIGKQINEEDEQLAFGSGYDHNFVIDGPLRMLNKVAEVKEPTSGRTMELYATQPGVQFYTGNFVENVKGKGKSIYQKRSGFCLETQHFPDSPNQPKFPSTVLKKSDTYAQKAVFKFMAG